MGSGFGSLARGRWGIYFLAFVGVSVGSMILVSLAVGICGMIGFDQWWSIRVSQGVFMLGIFLLPVVVWRGLLDPPLDFGLRAARGLGSLLVYGAVIIFCSLPPAAYAGYLNSLVDLPGWALELEVAASHLLRSMLSDDSVGAIVGNLLVIALLPAVCEELFFRGALLGILRGWTRSAHWGVFLSAVLFSVLHLQFAGFLPRLFLGVVLGYLYVNSGTLWVPILAHFLNNALSIVQVYSMGFEAAEGAMSFRVAQSYWYIALPLFLILPYLLKRLKGRAAGISTES